MHQSSLSDRENEKTKLSELLKKELPQSVEFLWDAKTGALIFQKTDDKKLLFAITYGYPVYPSSDDADYYLRRIKSIISKS